MLMFSSVLKPHFPGLRALVFALLVPAVWMLAACGESTAPGSADESERAEAFANFEPLPIADPCKKVALGSDHYMVIDQHGVLHTWGNPINGQLGYQIEKGVPAYTVKWPRPVAMPGKVKCVGAGMQYSVAVLEDGTVWHWGTNRKGEISPDLPRFASTPTQITEIKNATAVAVGGRHALALLEDGRVMSWGSNYSGQIGRGFRHERERAPIGFIENLSQIQFIAAGPGRSFAIRADGALWAWGAACVEHGENQCDFDAKRWVLEPAFTGMGGVVDVAPGNSWWGILTSAGEIYVWGSNRHSQQGDGKREPTFRNTFSKLLLNDSAKDVGALISTGYAVVEGNRVFGWGRERYGSPRESSVETQPTLLTLPNGVEEIFSSTIASIYRSGDGCLYAFGSNKWGVLTNGKLGPRTDSVLNDIKVEPLVNTKGQSFCSN